MRQLPARGEAEGQSIKQEPGGRAEAPQKSEISNSKFQIRSVGLLFPGRPIREDVTEGPATIARHTNPRAGLLALEGRGRSAECKVQSAKCEKLLRSRSRRTSPSHRFLPAVAREARATSITAARPRRIFTAFPIPGRHPTPRQALQPPEGAGRVTREKENAKGFAMRVISAISRSLSADCVRRSLG